MRPGSSRPHVDGAAGRAAAAAERALIDDWAYAWSVEHLLRTGELKILDWSVSLNVAQVLWGALFCVPFGFSFTAVRLSTWVASLLALIGLHTMLRELGASRRDTLTGVALVCFYPVFFILSFSFMTDVPFVAMVVWFFAALVRAIKRDSTPSPQRSCSPASRSPSGRWASSCPGSSSWRPGSPRSDGPPGSSASP